jgi:hypothetical protein
MGDTRLCNDMSLLHPRQSFFIIRVSNHLNSHTDPRCLEPSQPLIWLVHHPAECTRVAIVRLTPEAMEGTSIGLRRHPIDIINTNSTLASTLCYGNLA